MATTPTPTAELTDNIITDPPPPYPSGPRGTPRRSRHRGHLQAIHTHITSADSYSDLEAIQGAPRDHAMSPGPNTDESEERASLLAPSGHLRNPSHRRRPRSISHGSTHSMAPSLTQTVLSLFELEDGEGETGVIYLPEDSFDDHHLESLTEDYDGTSLESSRRNANGFRSVAGWKLYFRPMSRSLYYRSLVHLLFINFPYALAAWLYLFIFTVSGTTLLVVLPLGALLCFLNLLGARTFARGELALQTTFHSPLSYPAPFPPLPIFTRHREATTVEIESGRMGSARSSLVRERSFYKNSYAMFTDPTSYQALFYFIVIKPAITIILLLFVLLLLIPSMVFILPAPAALRAVRKLGRWQANIAVEGLYHAVR